MLDDDDTLLTIDDCHPLPFEAFTERDESISSVPCGDCGRELTKVDDIYNYCDELYYCKECFVKLLALENTLANEYAEENCWIADNIPEYSDDQLYFCSRDGDVDTGLNAYNAWCRHDLTNYDDLINNLRFDGYAGTILYRAIRRRITTMLNQS